VSALIWQQKTLLTRENAKVVMESVQTLMSLPGWAVLCEILLKESAARRRLAGTHTINPDDAKQIFSHNQNVLCADTLDAIQSLPEAIMQQGEELLKKREGRQQ
jgi:hypothetical protein